MSEQKATVREEPSMAISDEAWETAVSSWIDTHVRSTPIAQAVAAWNHLGAALPYLRQLLEEELKKPPAPPAA